MRIPQRGHAFKGLKAHALIKEVSSVVNVIAAHFDRFDLHKGVPLRARPVPRRCKKRAAGALAMEGWEHAHDCNFNGARRGGIQGEEAHGLLRAQGGKKGRLGALKDIIILALLQS